MSFSPIRTPKHSGDAPFLSPRKNKQTEAINRLVTIARTNFQETLDRNIEKSTKQQQIIRESSSPAHKKSSKKTTKRRKTNSDSLNDKTSEKVTYPYAVSLFDRYVDVSKFNKNTKLRRMCRDWLENDLNSGRQNELDLHDGRVIDENEVSDGDSNLKGPLSTTEFQELENKLNSSVPELVTEYVPEIADLSLWVKRWKTLRQAHVEKTFIKMDAQKDDLDYISKLFKQYDEK
jgi:hypothetical protein